jgi:hypothetical protein
MHFSVFFWSLFISLLCVQIFDCGHQPTPLTLQFINNRQMKTESPTKSLLVKISARTVDTEQSYKQNFFFVHKELGLVLYMKVVRKTLLCSNLQSKCSNEPDTSLLVPYGCIGIFLFYTHVEP